MKLKNKIVITGISALSLLGSGTFAISGIGEAKQSNIVKSNSRKTKNISLGYEETNTKQKLTTMTEVEQYIPGISGEINLYFDNAGYAGYAGNNPRFAFNSSPETTVSLEEDSPGSGTFRFKVKVATGDYGYLYQYQGTSPYVNSYESSYSDMLEIYKYEDYIIFAPIVEAAPSSWPIGTYYDILPDTSLQGHGLTFPDTALDTWNFKVKINTQAEISGDITSPSSNSISFNLMKPVLNTNPSAQPTSFTASVDGNVIQTFDYTDPGTVEEFTINNAAIDNSISQEITLNFGELLNEVKFNTVALDHTTSSTLSATKFDDTKIEVKIEDFINGESWTAADEFQFIINGEDALASNIFDISLIQNGAYDGYADVTGYDQSQPITVKVRYLDDSGLESFSNEITLDGDDVTPPPVGTPFNPGEITTKNITQKTATVSFANLTQGSDLQEVETFEISGTSTSSVDNPEGATKAISVPNQLLGDIREANLTGLLIESSNTIDIVFKNNIGDVVATETVTFNTPAFTDVLASTTGLEVAYDTSVFNGVNLKWNYTQGVDKWGAITEPGPVVVILTFHNMVTGARVNTGTFTFSADPQSGAYAINFDDMIASGQITQENIDGGFSVNSDTTTGLPENGFDTRSGGYKIPGWMLALIITFSILTAAALAWLFILLFKRRKEKTQENSLLPSVKSDERVITKIFKKSHSPASKAHTYDFRLIYNIETVNKVVAVWKCNLDIREDGQIYEPDPVIIKVKFNNMPEKLNADTFTFTVDATKKSFTIDFDKMIKENKIIQMNVHGGFSIESPTTPQALKTPLT